MLVSLAKAAVRLNDHHGSSAGAEVEELVHSASSVMAGWKVNLKKWAGGGDKEAIMDFKHDAGCCNDSLESRTIVYMMGSSLLRWTVSSPRRRRRSRMR